MLSPRRRGGLAAGHRVALLAALLAGSIITGNADQLTVRGRYAEVTGDVEARQTALRVASLVDQAVSRIAPLVGARDLRPVRAIIYLDRGRFLAATQMPPRAPVVGLATFPSEIIYIDGTGLLTSIERIVPHEVAHVMVARSLGPAASSLPTWANEGIAEYAAGENSSQVDPVTLRAIGQGRFIPLIDLDAAFRDKGDTSSLAYAEAASIVNTLVTSRGPQVIAQLLTATRERGSFASALSQVTGMDEAQLDSSWRRSVSRRWRWPLLFDSQALLLVAMLILFLLAYIRYRRERRRRQEMPDSDW